MKQYDADFPQVPSTGAANASVLLILRLAPRDVFVLPPFFHALVSSILFFTEKLINESHAHAIWVQIYLSTETEERATIVSSPTVDGWRVRSHVVRNTGGTVEASKKSVKFICNYGLEDGWKGHDGKLAGGWVGATWAIARGIGGNHRWCRCHGFKKIRRIYFLKLMMLRDETGWNFKIVRL